MGFFKPAWQSEDYAKASVAVRKINDQKKLLVIAKESQNSSIRKLAVDKLNDKTILSDIMNDRKEELIVRKAAAYNYTILITGKSIPSLFGIQESISDQLLLSEFIISWQNWGEFSPVIKRMKDQQALFYIAKTLEQSMGEGHRYTEDVDGKAKIAISMITNRELLHRLNSKIAIARLHELDIDDISEVYIRISGTSSNGTVSGTVEKGNLKIGNKLCISHVNKTSEDSFVLERLYNVSNRNVQEIKEGDIAYIPIDLMNLKQKIVFDDIVYIKK